MRCGPFVASIVNYRVYDSSGSIIYPIKSGIKISYRWWKDRLFMFLINIVFFNIKIYFGIADFEFNWKSLSKEHSK